MRVKHIYGNTDPRTPAISLYGSSEPILPIETNIISPSAQFRNKETSIWSIDSCRVDLMTEF